MHAMFPPLMLLLAVLAGGCGGQTWAGDRPGETSELEKVPMELQPIVAAAVADVARRLSVNPAEIEVVEARAVTWPDSSLGCPEPGMSYMQVLTPGFLVRLRAAGQFHHYHAGAGGTGFLCPAGREKPPLPGSPESPENTNGTS